MKRQRDTSNRLTFDLLRGGNGNSLNLVGLPSEIFLFNRFIMNNSQQCRNRFMKYSTLEANFEKRARPVSTNSNAAFSKYRYHIQHLQFSQIERLETALHNFSYKVLVKFLGFMLIYANVSAVSANSNAAFSKYQIRI